MSLEPKNLKIACKNTVLGFKVQISHGFFIVATTDLNDVLA